MSELPPKFYHRLHKEGLEDLILALDGESPTSIRINTLKKCDLNFNLDPVMWCGDGAYLESRPKFTLDPLIHAGAYYVQEASSMIVGKIAAKYQPKIVLDLCAAPGGKSTHLSEIVGVNGCVVANEVIRSRASILSENIQKWGSGNVIVTSCDAKRFSLIEGLFDIVVADVPCSGEGMFRKDVDSREHWSCENVALSAARGRRIVSDAWSALKENGILIYSTCTFNRDENQENVKWICEHLGAEVESFDVPTGAVASEYGVNFYPNKIKGEGFFVAVLRKTVGSSGLLRSVRSGKGLAAVGKADVKQLQQWVGGDMQFKIGGDLIYGYNEVLASVIDLFLPFGLVYSGVAMGQMIRGELKPAHSLALYYDLQFERKSDLEIDEAVRFLAKQQLQTQCYQPGLSLVRYKELGIGWAKGLGNRVNNLYPQNWRILNI